jgi:hypothetical protein
VFVKCDVFVKLKSILYSLYWVVLLLNKSIIELNWMSSVIAPLLQQYQKRRSYLHGWFVIVLDSLPMWFLSGVPKYKCSVFVLRRTASLLTHDGQAISTLWSMVWLFYNAHQFNYLSQCPGARVQRIHSTDAFESTPKKSLIFRI